MRQMLGDRKWWLVPKRVSFNQRFFDSSLCYILARYASFEGRHFTLTVLLVASGAHGQDQSKTGQDVQPATLLDRVNPDYPDSWKKEGLQGTVHLHLTIAKDGNVRDVKVVDGDSRLAKSAEKAVKQWWYKPALRNGEPVEVRATVAVAFALKAVQR